METKRKSPISNDRFTILHKLALSRMLKGFTSFCAMAGCGLHEIQICMGFQLNGDPTIWMRELRTPAKEKFGDLNDKLQLLKTENPEGYEMFEELLDIAGELTEPGENGEAPHWATAKSNIMITCNFRGAQDETPVVRFQPIMGFSESDYLEF